MPPAPVRLERVLFRHCRCVARWVAARVTRPHRRSSVPLPATARPKRGHPAEPDGPAATPARPAWQFPRRLALLMVKRDESGSMRFARTAQGVFVDKVLAGAQATPAGRQAADRIYVGYYVLSGDVSAGPFVPLPELAAHMPAFEPDGFTPVGPCLARMAADGEAFLAAAYAAEATVVEKKVLVFGDLKPNGPDGGPQATEDGVAAFLAFAARHGVEVAVVAPNPEAVNAPLAARLVGPGGQVRYLNDDPEAVLRFTLDAVSSASRKLAGGRGPLA